MAVDFSREYAPCIPENATPEYFSYMNGVGERMRSLDPAIREETFKAVSENYREWKRSYDSMTSEARPHDPQQVKDYGELTTRVREETAEKLIELAHQQQREKDSGR
jgi:ketosteroid isomerase-like protein